ncbi:MAG TPA: PAS domain S-box protein [Gemmatimonadales bacterium]
MLRVDTSIERKLPLLVSGLLLTVVVALAVAAYNEVLREVRVAAAERLQRTGRELGAQFDRQARQRDSAMSALAADRNLQAFLASGGQRARVEAHAAARRLATAPRGVAVELWGASGNRLLRIGDSTLPVATPAAATDSVAVSPLRAVDSLLDYDVRVAVALDGRLVGQVVQLRRNTPSVQSRQTLGALIGQDAGFLYGNAAGAPWTDFAQVIPSPPDIARQPGALREYERDGASRLGRATPIAGTPWLFLIDFPRSQVYAPAREYLNRMAVIAVLIVAVGTFGAWAVSRRITQPLRGLTAAAEAIAAGDLSKHVAVPGRDELGRLATAFNTMADHVAVSHDRLESQVKERTRELRATEERFRAVSETANDAIVSADHHGQITYFNPAAERIFGYAAGDVLGQPLTLLMPERLRDAHLAGLKRYLVTSEPRVVGKTVELAGRRNDGTEFPVELSLATWRTEGAPSFTGILRDITDRKKADELRAAHANALDRFNVELRAVNQELESFSYSVSHDLRAPLRAIDGFSRMLLEDHGGELAGDAQRLLGIIRANTKRMGALIDDLLAFSQLGRKELNVRSVNMTALFRDVADEVRRDAQDRPLDIVVDPLPVALGDPALIRQVVANLLHNAVKFTRGRSPARIVVGAQPNGTEHVYHVRDNGVGFDMQYVNKLFGVFQRLHRVEEFEGTGVGLAIVQRIVHRHGGRVWAEASPEQGAKFYFTLPAEAQPQ